MLKWVHVLLAIVAIGANVTYGIWLAQGKRHPEHLAFALRGVKLLDDRVANPCYALLLITGIANAFIGGWSLTTPWILVSLVLYAAVFGVALFGYTPTLRRQVQLAEEGKVDSAEYAVLSQNGTVLGIVLAVLVAAITFFMVVKPPLWTA